MFPTKCQGQNDRIGHLVKSRVCQNLDFSIGFAIKISIFILTPLLRFLCLINSFYRRYASCMYYIYIYIYVYRLYPTKINRYPIYPICLRVALKQIVFQRTKSNCCWGLLFTSTPSGEAYFLTACNHYHFGTMW